MKRIVLALVLSLFPVLVQAQDAETTQPYDLQVVLRCGAHNWLGKQFRDDLRNDLAGMLQDALGSMARISVVDLKEVPAEQWQPLWKEVDAKGFVALGGSQELTGTKTHFLRVDFVNGQYEIQARQLDGLTGFVSPWRRERTADRAFVSRTAGKLIAQDFGIIGTVDAKSPTVKLQFKAAQGGPLERWVHKGDVFAVFAVSPRSAEGKIRASELRERYVQAQDDAKSGSCTVKVLYRGDENPFKKAGIYRAIKISTASGPMRLRLVDDKGQPHVRALQLRVHSEAFQTTLSREEEVLNPDRGGQFVTKRAYDQIAYARVVTGASEIARIPVPILDDREVTAVVGLTLEKEQAGQLQAVRSELLRRYLESVLVQRERYLEISKLVIQTKNTEALKRAEASRNTLDEDLKNLRAQKDQFKKDIGTAAISVSDCDTLETKMDEFRVQLNRLIGQLIEMERLANAPDRVERKLKIQQLYNQAQVLVDSQDFEGAMNVYRQLVKEYPDEPKPKKDLEALEQAWAIKSPAHQQARDFIYKDWPASKSSDDIAAKLPMARQKMQVCVQVGDKLTLAKLRATLAALTKVLSDEIQALTRDGNEDADKSAKLKKIAEDFQKFGEEVEAATSGK